MAHTSAGKTKVITRKLPVWTIAYYSPDYDEIHIDEKFADTPLMKDILKHELKHARIGGSSPEQWKYEIRTILEGEHESVAFRAFRYKPLVMLNIFWFITFPIDQIEFNLWKKFSNKQAR